MDEAEIRLRAAGCPKINLQTRSTNTNMVEFYRKIGYTVDDVVSFGKRLKPDVLAVFHSYPQEIRTKLMFLRQLILSTADSLEQVGELEETLKWGEPEY